MVTSSKVKSICMDIISLAISKSETTKSDIFVKYFPHTNEIDIEIYPNGFKDINSHCEYYYFNLSENDIKEKLENVLSKLKEIKGEY